MADPDLLERLAAEELLSEAKRGAARASLSGPSGWQKCPLPKTNKMFLNNTLLHTLSSNRLRKEPKSNDSNIKQTEKAATKPFDNEKEWSKKSYCETDVKAGSLGGSGFSNISDKVLVTEEHSRKRRPVAEEPASGQQPVKAAPHKRNKAD